MFMHSTLKGSKTRPNRRKTESGRRGLREISSGGSGSGSNRYGKRSAKGAPASHGRPASNGSASHGKRSASGASGSSTWSGKSGAPASHGKPVSNGGTRANKGRQSTWSFKSGEARQSNGNRRPKAGGEPRRERRTMGTPPPTHARRRTQTRIPPFKQDRK